MNGRCTVNCEAPVTAAVSAPSGLEPPFDRSLSGPTYSEDSANARPTLWAVSEAAANVSVT